MFVYDLKKHTMLLVTREIKIKTTKLFQFICIENYNNKNKTENTYILYKEVRTLVNCW